MEIQLKRLRREAGYKSRDAFAAALGDPYNARQIKAWEIGERKLSLEQACVIADFLVCSLDELAGRRFEVPEAPAPDPAHRGLVESYDSLSEEGREVARPRMIFLSECQNVSLAGFTVRNSPAWNIHPILCEHVDALCLSIEGPKNSHNTDGFDPESCGFVRILGCQFSVGDDCIAIKSGKLGIEPELRPATHDVLISHCYMHDGHGAVVLGSEAAGGIKDLTVSKCLFERTDRGLRVKTRRGRGKDAVNEGITFEHIRMDEVLTPFVVNSFYFCDKDGKTDYVQSREALPVDDRTPGFGATTFCDIEATNCHAAAAYITGLPESKVTRLTFQDVHVTFAPDAEPFVPAMACGVEPMVRQGIIAQNVKVLDLQNVVIEGQDGEELQLQNVDKVVRS